MVKRRKQRNQDTADKLVYGNDDPYLEQLYGPDRKVPKGSRNSHPAKQNNDRADPVTSDVGNAGFPE